MFGTGHHSFRSDEVSDGDATNERPPDDGQACDDAARKIEHTLDVQIRSDALVPPALDVAMESIQTDDRYCALRQQAVGVLPAAD
ncbi:hypothetical protein [Auritidibacter sp. NML100628]|uniref:hypothetical protein n=1 Tax=Auritidibacter sp. NML100628 TaxID=2170742 RepID=UPI000D739910|nr:hypothetical protein [Auritidibacter sp. NML100628]PXA75739.1 hypothetical protein DCC24_10175 [Auritidibacter sp. NML100628]